MAKIKMARIDYRLIHGQVITKWVKQANANQIIIVNDELARDEFMASIYVMAAPPSVKVHVYSNDEAKKVWEENEFGNGNVFMLFRSCSDALRCVNSGVKLPELNVGGIASGPGKQSIIGQVSVSKEEFEMLTAIQDKGVDVNIQVLPNEPRLELRNLITKIKF